jgi:hypothetical protein
MTYAPFLLVVIRFSGKKMHSKTFYLYVLLLLLEGSLCLFIHAFIYTQKKKMPLGEDDDDEIISTHLHEPGQNCG